VVSREQAEEVIEDVKENAVKRSKRQAYRDNRYPRTLWSNGVSYSFHWNASQDARRVFKKAAELWQSLTCINFAESNTGI
ncbi:hypothetical protein Angca_006338, partial [Angiostrongylus cantonensis]